MKNNNSGFSLFEIVLTISLSSILILALVPNLAGITQLFHQHTDHIESLTQEIRQSG